MDCYLLNYLILSQGFFWKTLSLNTKAFLKCAFLLTNAKPIYVAHTLHAASITFQ